MDDPREISGEEESEEYSASQTGTDDVQSAQADTVTDVQSEQPEQTTASIAEDIPGDSQLEMEPATAASETEGHVQITDSLAVADAQLDITYESDQRVRHVHTNTEVDDFVRHMQVTNIELSSRLDIVTAEKRDLLEQLQRRMVEYDQLKADHAEMVRERAEAQRIRIETQVQLDEARAEESIRRFREERLRNELNELQKQVTWLDDQLNTKQNELFQVRKDSVERTQDSSLEITRLRSRIAEHERELNELRSTVEQKDAAAKKHSDTVRELRESFDALDTKYARELEAQTRLATLYREANEDAERRCTELTRAVAELQQLVRDASSELLNVETAKRAEVDRAEAAVNEKEMQLESLRSANAQLTEQLDEAKRELEMIRLRRKRVPLLGLGGEQDAMNPDSSAVSSNDAHELAFAVRFLAQRGLTFTQLFNEYVDVCEAFEDERGESARLRGALTELEADVRAKEPIYRRQREELLKSLDALGSLTQRVETQAAEFLELQRRNEELVRKQSSWRDDVERYRQRCADLAEQVRTLLIQLEGRSDQASAQSDFGAEGGAQAIISERLVTFRSVAELQSRNEELLVLVRSLSEKREREERDELTATTRDLRDQIKALEEQLEDLRSVREEQTNAIDALEGQREMYKALFVQFARVGANLPPSGASDAQPSFTALLSAVQQLVEQHVADRSTDKQQDNTQMQETQPIQTQATNAAVEQKQSEAVAAELEASRRLIGDLEKRLSDAHDKLQRLIDEMESSKREQHNRESTLRNEHEETRKQLQDSRYQNARVQSQCELAVERCKLLQTTLDGYKKEIETLRESNQIYTKLVGDHEQSICSMKQELVNANERAVRAEVQLSMTREQLAVVKQSEQRFCSELESARQSHQSHQLVLNNLQALQNRLDIDEWETKARLSSQIKLYETECTELRKRVQEERDTHDTIIRSLERERNEARALHETERVEHDATRRKLIDAEGLIRQIRGRITSVEADRRDVNVSTRDEADSADTEGQSYDVVVELEQVRSEAQRLRTALASNESQLEGARRNIGELKKLVGTLEQSLSDQLATHRTVSESLNDRLSNESLRANNAERELQRLTEELASLRGKSDAAQREASSQLESLRSELAITSKRNADLETRLKQVDAFSTESHADLEMRAQLANEYRVKFENEAAEHSRDVQLLIDAKRRLEEAELALVRRSHEFDTRCMLLENERDNLKQSEQRLRADMERIQSQLTDAQAENRVLFERFDALNAKLAYHESRQRDPLAGLPSTSAFLTPSTPAANTLLSAGEQQLTELVKLIRREKEIATTQCELVRAEADRLRVRAEIAEKQAESLRSNVNELQGRLAESIEKSAQHAELTSRLEQLSVFQESNRVLRDEKERLFARVRELENSGAKGERELAEARARLGEVQRNAETAQVERDVLQKEVTNLRQRITVFSEQVAQHASCANEISRLRGEIEELQTTQLPALRSQLETASNNEASARKLVEEKESMITQLKLIGRKYKTESQAARNQVEELQARVRTLESAHAETDATRSARAGQLEADVTRLQEEQRRAAAAHQAELNAIRNELNTVKKQKSDADEASTRNASLLRQTNEKLAALHGELAQVKATQAQRPATAVATGAGADVASDDRARRLELELGRVKQLKARLVDEYEQKIKELQAENSEMRRASGLQTASQSAAAATSTQGQMETVAEEQPAVTLSAAGASAEAASDVQTPVQASAQQPPPAAAVKPVVSAVRPTVQAAPVAASPIPVAPLPQTGAASRQTASIRPMPVSTGTVTQTSTIVVSSQSAAATMTVTATVPPLQPTIVTQTLTSAGNAAAGQHELPAGGSNSSAVESAAASDASEANSSALAGGPPRRRGLIRAAANAASGIPQQQAAQSARSALVSGALFSAGSTPSETAVESSSSPAAQVQAAMVSRRSPTTAVQQQVTLIETSAVAASQRTSAPLRVKRSAAAAQLGEGAQPTTTAVISLPAPAATVTSVPETEDELAAHAMAAKRTRREEEGEASTSSGQSSGVQVLVVAPQPHTLTSDSQPTSDVSAMQTDERASVSSTGAVESHTVVVDTPHAGAGESLQTEENSEPSSGALVSVDAGEQHLEPVDEQAGAFIEQEANRGVGGSDAPAGAEQMPAVTGQAVEQEEDDRTSQSSSVIMLSSGSDEEGDDDGQDDGGSEDEQDAYEEEEYEQSGEAENEEEYEEEQAEDDVEQQSDDQGGESVADEAVSEHEDEAGEEEDVEESADVHEVSGDTVVETDSMDDAGEEHENEREGMAEQQQDDELESAGEQEGVEEMEQEEAADSASAVEDVEQGEEAGSNAADDDVPTTVPKNPGSSGSHSGFAIEMESEMGEFADEERVADQPETQSISNAGQQSQQPSAQPAAVVTTSSNLASSAAASQPAAQNVVRTQPRATAQMSDLEKRSLRFGSSAGQASQQAAAAPATTATVPTSAPLGGSPQQPPVRLTGGRLQRPVQPGGVGGPQATQFRASGANQFSWRPRSAAGGAEARQMTPAVPNVEANVFRPRINAPPSGLPTNIPPQQGSSVGPVTMVSRTGLLTQSQQQQQGAPRFGGAPSMSMGMARTQMPGAAVIQMPGAGMPMQQVAANNPFALRRPNPQLGAPRSASPIQRGAAPPRGGLGGGGVGPGPNANM